MAGFLDFTLAPDPSSQVMAQAFRQGREADLINQLVQQAQTGGQLDTDALMNSLLGANIDPQRQQVLLQSLGRQRASEQQIQLAQHQQAAANERLQNIFASPEIDRTFENAGPDDGPLEVTTSQEALEKDNPRIPESVSFRGQRVGQDQISAMLMDPNPEIRRLGNFFSEQLISEQKELLKERREVRKEYRDEIRKRWEPFSDGSKLQNQKQRIDQANHIIRSGNVSLDDDFYRNFSIAVLEDRGKEQIAELFKTPEQQKLFALLRPFFNTREVGGSNPSTREMLVTLSTLPGSAKSREANIFIAGMMQGEVDLALATRKAMNKYRNRDLTPAEFEAKVDAEVAPIREANRRRNEQLNAYSEAVMSLQGRVPPQGARFVFLPERGETIIVPENLMKQVVDRGGLPINV